MHLSSGITADSILSLAKERGMKVQLLEQEFAAFQEDAEHQISSCTQFLAGLGAEVDDLKQTITNLRLRARRQTEIHAAKCFQSYSQLKRCQEQLLAERKQGEKLEKLVRESTLRESVLTVALKAMQK